MRTSVRLCISITVGVLLSRYYQMFLDSLRSPDGKFPEHLEEDVLRPALVSRFRVARLNSRLISSTPSVQLENLNNSLENYKYRNISVTYGCTTKHEKNYLTYVRIRFSRSSIITWC